MALISKVTNLFDSVNSLADQATTAAKIVGCIPSILSNLPSILGQVGGNILKTVAAQATLIAQGIVESAIGIVENAINTATGIVEGYLNQIIQIISTIAATVQMVKELFTGLKDRAASIKDFVSNEENCTFAAASLLNCVASTLLKDLTKDVTKKINNKISTVNDYVDSKLDKFSEKGEFFNNYSKKMGNAVDKANAQVSALSIF